MFYLKCGLIATNICLSQVASNVNYQLPTVVRLDCFQTLNSLGVLLFVSFTLYTTGTTDISMPISVSIDIAVLVNVILNTFVCMDSCPSIIQFCLSQRCALEVVHIIYVVGLI